MAVSARTIRSEEVSSWRLAAFASPAILFAVMSGPAGMILPSLYAREYAIDLSLISLGLLVARILAAVIDPMIGYFCDRLETPFGRRRVFVLIGAVLSAISVQFLFRPGEDADFVYFLVAGMAMYVSWSFIEVAHASWAAELSDDYDGRSRVASFRLAATYVGNCLFILLPLTPFVVGSSYTFEVLSLYALIVGVLLPLAAILAGLAAPEKPTSKQDREFSLWSAFLIVGSNRAFVFFGAGFVIFGSGVAFPNALAFVFIDDYLGLGDRLPLIYGASVIAAVASVPLSNRLLVLAGKRTALVSACAGVAASCALYLFVPEGREAFWVLLIIDPVTTCFYVLGLIAGAAMLADIAEYDFWKKGRRRTAQYYAVYGLILKLMLAAGGAAAFALLDLTGYSLAEGSENSADAQFGLRLMISLGPALFFAAAIPLFMRIPIDRESQHEIRAAIVKRESEQRP